MIFFTRELYLGYQANSGWERKASREWNRRAKIYADYAKVIEPMLPASVRRLCSQGLHDGIIREASLKNGELKLIVDATKALSRFRGRHVQLRFLGVRGRPAVAKLIGQWWLYEEAHLCSHTRFCLQVLLTPDELEIEADELVIKVMTKPA